MARGSGRAVSVAELAAKDGIPLHFLSLILGELRQRGIVRALRGRDGGYELAVDPTALSIAEIVECLGGPMFPFPCLLGKGRCRECRGSAPCAAERALSRACNAAQGELGGTTLAEVANSLPLDIPEGPRRVSRSTTGTNRRG